MNITFSKKKSILRKGLLWFYFLLIVAMSTTLFVLTYLTMYGPAKEANAQEKSTKINKEGIKTIQEFIYLGQPIDTTNGIGKDDPFH